MIGERLVLSGIEKQYGAARAVRETNLEIGAGEFVSIVGPSGSGKTTLLTMIAGFEMPTTGVVQVGDRDVTSLAPNRRNIGMVFQKYALFPHMTVRRNVEFPLRMRNAMRSREARHRVEKMLNLVQLEAFADRYPHQLSGGQQQRVAVARALVFDPPVILMDEPLGALDKKLRESMQFEIKRIQENLGATVVYVTHDQEEALTMSDRVAVMHHGRVRQIGTPSELYGNPGDAFVADFVGTINFIPATVVEKTGSGILVKIGSGPIVRLQAGDERTQLFEIGAIALLAARPEHVSLSMEDDSSAATLRGSLETVVFAGATRTALVRLDDLADVIVRVQIPSRIEALPQRGAKVSLVLSTDRLKLFSPEKGTRT